MVQHILQHINNTDIIRKVSFFLFESLRFYFLHELPNFDHAKHFHYFYIF